jgi:phage-related protein
MQFFETIFLEEADKFIHTLDKKSQQKIMYNVRIAEQTNEPELFKKLNENIWEFRTKFLGRQIRILAFWDKTHKIETLVLATNGFIKKTSKTPKSEIERAERIRNEYFSNKKRRKVMKSTSRIGGTSI